MKIWYSSNVTRFAKKGLPHTSNQLSSKDYTLALKKIKAWNFLHLFLYASALGWENFKFITFTHLKLWFVEVGKFDACGRPLFTSLITNNKKHFRVFILVPRYLNHHKTWGGIIFSWEIMAAIFAFHNTSIES